MIDRLQVYRNSQLLGAIMYLDGTLNNNLHFEYDDDFFSSEQRPLDGISFKIGKSAQRIQSPSLLFYLNSLLPDGQRRIDLARMIRTDQDNVGEMLYRLAGDCIGDLAFVPESQAESYQAERLQYSRLPKEEFDGLLLTRETLLFDVKERISLFGAQNKTALYKEPGTKIETPDSWYKPSAFSPSNFIIKMPSRIRFLNINEYICTQLADACDLEVPKTYLYGGEDPLFISERYDRYCSEGVVERLHQEDIYQITEARGFYENSGGPGVNEVIDSLATFCTNSYADVRQFIKAFLFNYLIGNLDAHGRNFSILIAYDGEVRFSPSYDITAANMYYTLGDMAMRFGYEYQETNVTDEDLVIFCKQCTVDEQIVRQELNQLIKDITNKSRAICAETKLLCGNSFCDEMYEHLQRQLEIKASRFT
ncbi:MAG: HipA domain-containing protein [Coriobacteriia bacterium]|nr:HipA domain-containing protein [Coriobacteriia bacterium]MCL2749575.1 HipA domain-containing protein [Coriobacteriia bacterium]